MILVIGGSQQGKLSWTLEHFDYGPEQVADGAKLPLDPQESWEMGGVRVLWHLETLLRRILLLDWQPDKLAELQALLLQLPDDFVIICDNVGGGLVPVERLDRDWRELVGRTCCSLAAEAEQVWRIFCGLPQRLK